MDGSYIMDYTVMAEIQILAACIKYPDIVMREISSSSFVHQETKDIYESIVELHENEEKITPESIFRQVNQKNRSVEFPFISYVFSTVQNVHESNIPSALSILKEIRDKKEAILKLKESIQTLEAEKTDIQKVISSIYDAQDILYRNKSLTLTKTINDCFDMYLEELEERKKKRYIFGDSFLDSHLLKGASPGQIILIAGATGSGKSTVCLNLINNMINLDIPSIYISLEMDLVSTMDRLLALRTGIPLENWYGDENTLNSLKQEVEKERKNLENKYFRLIDDPELSLSEIRTIIKDFKLSFKVDYVCVYIDLITQVKDFISVNKGYTLANTIEVATNRLNAIAKKENCCIVAVAQMNRDADSARVNSIDHIESLRPTINHIKNSHALGERARTVLSVFRPKYYAERLFPDSEELDFMEDILQIQILKQSQGKTGTVGKYLFDGQCFSIVPYVETDENN